jgi:hypothetical protein
LLVRGRGDRIHLLFTKTLLECRPGGLTRTSRLSRLAR